SSTPARDCDVIVENGRILTVGPARAAGDAPETEVIDARGRTLVPGLIDMHAHALVPRCNRPNSPVASFDRAVSERMLLALRGFGITTIRSPANPTVAGLELRDDVNAARVPGPRVFAAGELINRWSRRPLDVRAEIRAQLPYRPDFIKLYEALEPADVEA